MCPSHILGSPWTALDSLDSLQQLVESRHELGILHPFHRRRCRETIRPILAIQQRLWLLQWNSIISTYLQTLGQSRPTAGKA